MSIYDNRICLFRSLITAVCMVAIAVPFIFANAAANMIGGPTMVIDGYMIICGFITALFMEISVIGIVYTLYKFICVIRIIPNIHKWWNWIRVEDRADKFIENV